MGTCFLYGNGSRSDLNFTARAYATEAELLASAPKENTLGVVTSVPPRAWAFYNAAPGWDEADGIIYFVVPLLTSMEATSFNMTKKYFLWLAPTECYQRISGAWRSMIAYIYKGGTWVQFSDLFTATINVTYPVGSTCSATDGTTTLTAPDTSGSWACVVPNTGTWTVTCTDGSNTATKSISITTDGQSNTTALAYVGLPTFEYTGSYTTADDGNNNWRIKFLTSGTLTFSKLQGAGSGIDIFCVGGGGGGDASGGCGGRTTTVKAKTVTAGTSYTVTVGAGGAAGASGGTSSFGSLASAAGGGGPGGTGGSGGGGSGLYISSSNKRNGGNGGSDGANGVTGYGTSGFTNGTGQGTTTREFGESSGTLYAGGGGGAGDYDCTSGSGGAGGGGAGGDLWDAAPRAGSAGTTNLGGGGGGGSSGGKGGSGIVIIRNKR